MPAYSANVHTLGICPELLDVYDVDNLIFIKQISALAFCELAIILERRSSCISSRRLDKLHHGSLALYNTTYHVDILKEASNVKLVRV